MITCLDVFPEGLEGVVVLVALRGRHAEVDFADVEHHGRLDLLDVGDRTLFVHDPHLVGIYWGEENDSGRPIYVSVAFRQIISAN